MDDKGKKAPTAVELEKCKEEILRRIAEKIKSDPASCEEFGASHSSHTSGSKHSSVTH